MTWRKALLWAAGVASLTVSAPAVTAQKPTALPGAEGLKPLAQVPPEAQPHIRRSMTLARGIVPNAAISAYYNTLRLSGVVAKSALPPGANNFAFDRAHPALPPTRMFDQMYYIGDEHVGAFVLVTREGIIQWDAMNNDKEAADVIEAGYRTLGLDPAKIRYLVITHAHGDHYGGVQYFTRKYPGIKVIASAADWDVMEAATKSRNRFGWVPPKRDMTVADGETLTLGGTKLTFYVSPGHTPGSLSSLVPVTDRGKRHLMGMFGGVGVPLQAKALEQYDASWMRFGKIAAAKRVDGILSTHPAYDGTLFYITEPSERKKGRNPWVLGDGGVRSYITAVRESVAAIRLIIRDSRSGK